MGTRPARDYHQVSKPSGLLQGLGECAENGFFECVSDSPALRAKKMIVPDKFP
jgi:hypothetical protein